MFDQFGCIHAGRKVNPKVCAVAACPGTQSARGRCIDYAGGACPANTVHVSGALHPGIEFRILEHAPEDSLYEARGPPIGMTLRLEQQIPQARLRHGDSNPKVRCDRL